MRRGFALPSALWLLVAISAVSVEVSALARSRRLAVANALDEARARTAAQSGVEHARAQLEALLDGDAVRSTWSDPDAIVDPWRELDELVPDSVALGDVRYRVTARDLGAALNVNRATEAELRRFLAALRVDDAVADRLAQSIMDWRDADDLHRGRGAERDHYLDRGLAELPANGPFQHVDELRHVMGVTPELLARVRPFLAVRGTGQVNVNAAPGPVLLALPGMTELAVEIIVRAQRSGRRIASLQDLTTLLPAAARETIDREAVSLLGRLTFETREVELASDGWVDGGPLRVRTDAVVARGGSAAFLIWSRTR